MNADDLLRELAPQVVGMLARRFGDFYAAEDAVQEALLAAATQWPEGMPRNPRGWLIQVASRRMTEQEGPMKAAHQRGGYDSAQQRPAASGSILWSFEVIQQAAPKAVDGMLRAESRNAP